MADEHERLDQVASWYTAVGFEGRMVEASAERLSSYCGGVVLEVGSGEGYVTRALSQRCERVVVVEPASDYAAAVRALALENVEVQECLIEDFDTDERFDAVVLAHVLEHVADPGGMLQKCAALVASGAPILIAVPNAGSIHRLLGVRLGMLPTADALSDADIAIGHRRVYDPATLRAELDGAGLRVEELRGQFFKPLANSQIDQLPEAVQAAFIDLGDDLPAMLGTELFARCTS